MKFKKIIISLIIIITILNLCSCGTKNIQFVIPDDYFKFCDTTEEGIEMIKVLSLEYKDIYFNNDGDMVIEVTKEQSKQWIGKKEFFLDTTNTTAQENGIKFSIDDDFNEVELQVPSDKCEGYNNLENLKFFISDIIFMQCILRKQPSDELKLEIAVTNIDTGEQTVHKAWGE